MAGQPRPDEAQQAQRKLTITTQITEIRETKTSQSRHLSVSQIARQEIQKLSKPIAKAIGYPPLFLLLY
jgi:hypothetical protein